jgi:hypothetical protein
MFEVEARLVCDSINAMERQQEVGFTQMVSRCSGGTVRTLQSSM